MPAFELLPPFFERLSKWTTRVFTQRVGHTFNEPSGREHQGVQAAKVLHLKVVNQFVSHEMCMPTFGANNNSECSDMVRSIAFDTKALRASF